VGRRDAWRAILGALLCLCLALPGHAETFTAYVVGITDGDTITVLDDARRQHKIRLAGIDAPEHNQPFGTRSTESIARLTFNKTVSISWRKKHHERLIGTVMVQPPDCPRCGLTLDVSQAQLAAGMAWWYRKYAKEQSPEARARYEFEEDEARVRRVGLWRDPNPVPPWEWRKGARGKVL